MLQNKLYMECIEIDIETLMVKEARTANRRLAKKRVQCLNEALCFVSSSVLADSLVLRNPLLRQAPKRCGEIRSAPFATTVRRITSASCARRFADFAQQADLLNPKNGSQLPSRDFANPPNRYLQFHQNSVYERNFQNFNIIIFLNFLCFKF